MKYKFKIYEVHKEGDLMVASGEGNNLDKIEKECYHYAIQYAQDYPIKIIKSWESEKS